MDVTKLPHEDEKIVNFEDKEHIKELESVMDKAIEETKDNEEFEEFKQRERDSKDIVNKDIIRLLNIFIDRVENIDKKVITSELVDTINKKPYNFKPTSYHSKH